MRDKKTAAAPADGLPVPMELIARRIYSIRGQRVMIDADLADLYQVPTKALNQAVRRNLERFPEDFMFRLDKEELENWRSQIVTSNPAAIMGLRRPPYAFTEHGVAMLSSALRSKRAVQMNILIVRAFVQIRELLASNKELAERIERLEAGQKEHASIIEILADEIDDLKQLPEPPRRPIGFQRPEEE
jgi:ORF6N domain